MAVLVISQLPPGTEPQALVNLLREMGFSGVIGKISISEDSGQPMALVTLDISATACHAIARYLNGHFWHGQLLEASETHIFRE